MIARLWRATTRPGMGESYLDYLKQTGLHEFRRTPGSPEDERYFPESEMRDRLELFEVVAVEPSTSEGSDA